MAGMGSRFRKAGYDSPKYMIDAKGKSLFYWSLISLKAFDLSSSNFIFIVRDEDKADQFINQECEKLGITNYHIVLLDHLTDGQATTTLYGKPYWVPNKPLLIYNIDTHVNPKALYKDTMGDDGWIPCFDVPGEKWSFVKLNDQGMAVEVREKKRISNHATIGLYWFSSAELYEEAYNKYYSKQGREEKGERYIAPLYNQLINDGMKVTISQIPCNDVHVLGTPEELEDFLKSAYDYKFVE